MAVDIMSELLATVKWKGVPTACKHKFRLFQIINLVFLKRFCLCVSVDGHPKIFATMKIHQIFKDRNPFLGGEGNK